MIDFIIGLLSGCAIGIAIVVFYHEMQSKPKQLPKIPDGWLVLQLAQHPKTTLWGCMLDNGKKSVFVNDCETMEQAIAAACIKARLAQPTTYTIEGV